MTDHELQYERLGDANKTYPASTLVVRKQYVDEAIAELKAKLYEAEKARIEAGADAADYYQQNRRLKRALWIARANYCHNFRVDWYISRHPHSKMRQSVMENTLIMAEMNCRKKAMEYK